MQCFTANTTVESTQDFTYSTWTSKQERVTFRSLEEQGGDNNANA